MLGVTGRWIGAAWADAGTKATWRMDAQQAGHGAMGDMGVHMVDMVRAQIGEFRRVKAAKAVAYPDRSAPGINRPADADDIVAAFARGNAPPLEPPPDQDYKAPSLARAEWEHINRVLSDAGGNISEAARRLGIHRRSLQRKLQKYPPNK